MDLTVKKASALIQVKAKGLSTTQRKLINALVFLAQKDGIKTRYETQLATVKSLCNINTNNNDEIKEKLRDLTTINLEFNIFEKDKQEIWGVCTLVSQILVDFNSGKVRYSFSPDINEQIIIPKIYSPLNLVMVANLSSSYSIILYELLRDYIKSPAVPKISIKDFRGFMGLSESEYKRFPDFRRRVLESAIEEINEKTDLQCEYELILSGRKYTHIQFFIKAKRAKIMSNMDKMVMVSNQNAQIDLLSYQEAVFSKKVIDQIAILLKIEKNTVEEYFSIYGEERVKEVFEYVKKNNLKNPSGFFLKALKNGYQLNTLEVIKNVQTNDFRMKKAENCFSALGEKCHIRADQITETENVHCSFCPRLFEQIN